MKQITSKKSFKLLKEKFPKFQAYWDSYIKAFGEDQGISIQMIPIINYVSDAILLNDNSDLKEILEFVEFLLVRGDESLKNAIATTFLEALLAKDFNEKQFRILSKLLGKESVEYCKAWDEFTGVKTPGLWD